MPMESRRKKIYIALTVLLSLAFVALAVFVFRTSYLRLGEAFVDFGKSMKYYFCTLFRIPAECDISVVRYSDLFNHDTVIPQSSEVFDYQSEAYRRLLIDKNNFTLWRKSTGKTIGEVARVLTLVLPLLVLLLIGIKLIYQRPNTKHNIDTKPLRIHKAIIKRTILPVRDFIKGYIAFVGEHFVIVVVWTILWILNLNFGTIIIEFLAYYFYFAISFDVLKIYVQFVKLFIDLKVFFGTVPIPLVVILAVCIFEHWRRKIADLRLRHFEARNCGFIKELPIVSMTCGSMGKKKTTVITDMALSQEVMFRQEAFQRLQKADLKFPYFPWIAFEEELKKCMAHKTIYNLATCKEFVSKKADRYEKHHNDRLQLYGYDSERYGLTYDDTLKVYSLFDVMETYAKLYFIYVIESSLLVSNYSVREDNVLMDKGNFPLWNMNFFRKRRIENSHHAHILDFDVLRLGKKIIADNPKAGSFEFGVVVITEVGKERGNNLELKEQKKVTDETNQKNDLFNSWLKMCRHSATVDNFPFIKVFTDEQRPESWGADARDLSDIIHIVSSGEQKIVFPCYDIEEMISEWLFNKFIGLYYDFRFIRGDNTLLIYLLKQMTSILYKRNIRIYNKYGYSRLMVETECGTMDRKRKRKRYFLSSAKIYSDRFSTDCFSDFFNDMARKTKIGFADYAEYLSSKATVDELKQQHSYFIEALYKYTKGGDDDDLSGS